MWNIASKEDDTLGILEEGWLAFVFSAGFCSSAVSMMHMRFASKQLDTFAFSNESLDTVDTIDSSYKLQSTYHWFMFCLLIHVLSVLRCLIWFDTD